ncbi:Dps family protein [Mucilaginibacter koreensis]
MKYMNTNEPSLAQIDVKPVVDHLNELLANYHIHYQKIRGCHWNVKGHNFFTLHVKFEELYTEAFNTIDELAERVLTLGKAPFSRFDDYIKTSVLKEVNTIGMKEDEMVRALLDDMNQLIVLEQEILDITTDAKDDGTNDMVNRFMQFQQKNVWMLRSFLGE